MDPLAEVREICMALPEVIERPSHGAPTWFVQGKREELAAICGEAYRVIAPRRLVDALDDQRSSAT